MIRLAEAMSRRVVTAAADRPARDLAKRMVRERIGSVVIRRGAKIVGIVTERDVLRVLARGADPDRVRASDIMATPVVTATEDAPLDQAVRLMVTRNIKKLPVMRGRQLVGMVTFTDFARFGPMVHEALRAALDAAPGPTRDRFSPLAPEPPAGMYQ